MLAFNGHTVIVIVASAAFALRTPCKPVACIDLHSRLCGQHFKLPAAVRRAEFGGSLYLPRLITVYHPAVVIALAVFQCRKIFIYVPSEHLCRHEVHRSPGNWLAFPCRYQRLICRQVFRSIEPQFMPEDAAASFPVEIEICMVGKIDHRRRIAFRCQRQPQLVLLAPLVSRHCLQRSRIPHLPGFGIIQELHATVLYPALPYLILEAFRPSVKMIGPVVHRQLIFLAVKGETPEGYPVGISARNFPRTRTVAEIVERILVPEHHIPELSFPVRDIH